MRVAAEQRGERRAEQLAVEPEVDADDRRVLELRLGLAEQARALSRRQRDHDRVRVELVEGLDPRVHEHGRPGGFERPAGRLAVHLPERPRRQQQVGVAALAEQRRSHREVAGRGARLVAAQVQRRADEDVPEAVDRALRLAAEAQRVRERLAAGVAPAAERAQDPQPLAE